MEKVRTWNQYGFSVDVFDKYRAAARRSNSESLRVMSLLAVITAFVVIIYGYITRQAQTGVIFSFLQLGAGIFGMAVAQRKNSTRKQLLRALYILSAAVHLLAIYGTVVFGTDAFWIGTQVVVACYLLDYALRVTTLQIASYLVLTLSWSVTGIQVDSSRLIFSGMYLIIGLVTFYTMNRMRVGLILGREESQQQADTDLLTGLTMRTAAQQEIEDHLKSDEHGVMMLLDLDRFKSVNDRLGHQMGDKVLIDVAADLKKMFRNSDVLSRLGGDEFVVYMKSVPEKEWALQRASQVVREVRRWVSKDNINIQVTASVGIVMTDMVERNYDALYRAADIAMYSAKSQGGNMALFYTPEMLEHARETENSRHLTSEVVEIGDGMR